MTIELNMDCQYMKNQLYEALVFHKEFAIHPTLFLKR